MKGNKKVIERLNKLLSEELSAVHQYVIQAEMCSNWGYSHLSDKLKKHSLDEMSHAEQLIERIVFLEGIPAIHPSSKMILGKDVSEQFIQDSLAENSAIKLYNSSIRLATEADDEGTAEMLRGILKDEEKHLDWLDSQYDLIGQIGIQNYLTEQI